MLNRIKDFLIDREARPSSAAGTHELDELQVAAAALLVEAARMDDRVDADERRRIVELVRWRFNLTEDEGRTLVQEAERLAARSVQNYGFTSTIRQNCTDSERVQLVDMLWDVVYADGQEHDLETSLMRRIAGLLYVSDQESGAARKRAMIRHGLSVADDAL